MSPRQLFEKLEALGTIDPKILKKIRQEIENPSKTVKPKSVLSYLVKKNQITELQAVQLLKQDKTVDEFDVKKTSQEPSYDSDELTSLTSLGEPQYKPQLKSPQKQKSTPKPVSKPKVAENFATDATIIDQGQFGVASGKNDDEVFEVRPTHVPSNADIAPMKIGNEAVIEEVHDYAHYDAGFDGGYDQPEKRSVVGFQGKKNLADQWATKWLYIGFGILGVLLIMGAVLSVANLGLKAEDQYKAAMESFDKLAYQDAIKKFDNYIQDNPKHKYVPIAKARRVQSILASTYTAKNWDETITTAENLLPPLAAEEDSKIDEIRTDLAVMLPRSLLEITEREKIPDLPSMETELEKVKGYKKLIDDPVFVSGSDRKNATIAANLANIDNNLRAIEGQINKEREYNVAIREIGELGNAGQTDAAFATYTKLTRNYGDLAGREVLRNTMLAISLKERELVKPLENSWTVSNTRHPSPIQSSVVLATKTGTPVENLMGEVVNFLAEGSVYGINAGDGSIVWRNFVGYQTTIQPQLLDQDSLLIVNQQHHELILLAKPTGEIIWRTEIAEPFLAPSFNDSQIVVTTESGKVIQINRNTGVAEKSVQLPQTANVGCLVADRDPYIYQPGFYSNLYVLSNQDFSCREVFYLGHYKGSIAVPPQSWQGYILVAVNGGDFCDLFVLKPAKNGLELELVQVITRVTSGPVTSPMQKFGRWMLVTADNGEIRILEVVPTDEKNPVRKFASDRFENSSGQQAFVLTEGSNLWIAGLGISRFRIQRSLGQFKRDDILEHADTFLTPLQKLDDNIFHVRRRKGSGMLSASLVDANSLQPIWRTDFGGQLVGPPLAAGDHVSAVTNQGDLFRVGQEDFEKRFSDAAVRASTVVDDLQFDSFIQMTDDTFACLGPAGREDLLFGKVSTSQTKLMRLASPANKPACKPIAIGEDLIIASTEGQVIRVDPATGRMLGTPFQPPITPGSETQWFEPTLIQGGKIAIASGKGKDDQNQSFLYLLNAQDRKSILSIDSLKSDHPFKSRLVNDGTSIFGVVEFADHDQLVVVPATDKLEIAKTADLPGRMVEGPWLIDAGLLLKMDNEQLVLYGTDLTSKWSIGVSGVKLAGAPENVGSQILLTFRDGKMMVVEPLSGQLVNEYDLGQPIIHLPARVGQLMYISGNDGTVHIADLNQMSGNN